VPILRLPLAGELQGASANGFADGLVGHDGVEPFDFGVLRLDGALDFFAERLSWANVESEQRDLPKAAPKIKAVSSHSTPKLFPLAGELQGTLADGFAGSLVRRDGVEPFGLGLAPVTQEVNQTQGLTLRSCRRHRTVLSLQNLSRLRQPISLLSRASREIQTARFPL